MFFGVLLGLLACALWGLTYLLTLFLPEYNTIYISIARAIVMGLTAVGGLWIQRHFLRFVTTKDWNFTIVLSLVGNLIQPWCLFTAVQYAGVALAATFFGLVPVCVALISNERDKRRNKKFVPLAHLSLPLVLILTGLFCSNWSGLVDSMQSNTGAFDFLIGIIFAISSTAMWTWYPIKNADWLLEHPKVSPVFFTSMQCIVLLPIGLIAYFVCWSTVGDMENLLGPRPMHFVGWMIFAGTACSFCATALWNAMSQRVPTTVVGPMLVFETIFSVLWGLIYTKEIPSISLVIGMVLLLSGVICTLKIFEKKGVED